MNRFNSKNTEQFFFYDLETTGVNPSQDRIVQFAGVFTDLNLNYLGDPIVSYVKIPDEVIPHPEAICTTGLDVATIQAEGVTEFEILTSKLEPLLTRGNTCIIGFNSSNFDDNFLRHALYRNLYPAYEHEWKNGNSRMDLLAIFRFAHSIRPDGIQWPIGEEDRPSFSLVNLANANGFATHDAHDAMADVRNTIDLAKLLNSRQPRLWKYLYDHRTTNDAVEGIASGTGQPFLTIGRPFEESIGYLRVAVAITTLLNQARRFVCIDLTQDLGKLENASGKDLREIAEKERGNRTDVECMPVFEVRSNQAAVVAPYKVLRDADAERLGLSKSEIDEKLAAISQLPQAQLRRTLQSLWDVTYDEEGEEEPIAEEQLYAGGFVKNIDLAHGARLRESIRRNSPLSVQSTRWSELRSKELADRLVSRNCPKHQTQEQKQSYYEFVKKRLQNPVFGANVRLQEIDRLLGDNDHLAHVEILQSLKDHIKNLKATYGI